jgi:hypothetical protein
MYRGFGLVVAAMANLASDDGRPALGYLEKRQVVVFDRRRGR